VTEFQPEVIGWNPLLNEYEYYSPDRSKSLQDSLSQGGPCNKMWCAVINPQLRTLRINCCKKWTQVSGTKNPGRPAGPKAENLRIEVINYSGSSLRNNFQSDAKRNTDVGSDTEKPTSWERKVALVQAQDTNIAAVRRLTAAFHNKHPKFPNRDENFVPKIDYSSEFNPNKSLKSQTVSVSKSSTEKKNLQKKLQSQGPIDIGSQIKLMQNLADSQIKYLQSQQEIAIPGDLLELGQTVQSENKPTDQKSNTEREYCHCS
jgi:hypothetical protein